MSETDFEIGYNASQALRKELVHGVDMRDHEYDLVTAAVFAGGHILWEGAPGTAKTVASKTIARAIGGELGRVQGTPDVMATDITGGRIFDQKENEFTFDKGPVFKDVLHLDELNRIPAKSQAALLEVIEEGQVTIGPDTFMLPNPQIVVATQNPLSYEQGSGQVIDALRDRFTIGMYTEQANANRLKSIYQFKQAGDKVQADVLSPKDIQNTRERVLGTIAISPDMIDFAASIMQLAQDSNEIAPSSILGYRAFEAGLFIARAVALGEGKMSVNEANIKSAYRGVLPHRVDVAYGVNRKGLQPHQAVENVLSQV